MGRRQIRLLIGCAAPTVLAAVLISTVAAASVAAAAPPVPVVPSDLPVGAAATPPARLLHGTLLLPGREPVQVQAQDKYPNRLWRVRGGYLVDSELWSHEHFLGYRIDFLTDRGALRILVRRTPYHVEQVASDGRSYIAAKSRTTAAGDPTYGVTLRRIRVRDARPLDTRLDIAGEPTMVAATAHRVLVGYVPRTGKHRFQPRTIWWTTSTGRVRVAATTPRVPPLMPEGVQAASFGAHAFSVVRHGRQVVLDTRTGKRLWRTSPNEAVLRFSPDHKRVVTLGSAVRYGEQDEQYVAQRLSVRNSRTGRLLAAFSGVFEGPFLLGRQLRAETHWETSDAFVAFAYDSTAVNGDGVRSPVPEDPAPIRCRVSTATCERVLDDGALDGAWVTPRTS
ncbi:hypothetical protein [Nocardioides sp. URHA0020]|uniref:hypothetical protein n=1 Tax=Nocardioides sp. URHA0020 TaxID=1380392 RepID=UPI00048E86F5|nr:hypothetical protein [Nocardioides sp. URHA0020]